MGVVRLSKSLRNKIQQDTMSVLRKIIHSRQKSPWRILAFAYSVASGSKEHIDSMVKSDKVVVFMKGVPNAPRCGFSNAVVQILNMHGVEKFSAHDVLQDEHLRQGVKDYSKWPTIPQVYFNGEFLGGCDIMLEMHQNGELIEEFNKIGIKSALLDQPQPETKT